MRKIYKKILICSIFVLAIEITAILLDWFSYKELRWTNIWFFVGLNVVLICGLIVPRWLTSRLIAWFADIIGVDRKFNELFNLRTFLVLLIALPFSFYVLLGGIVKQTSPVLQFTIIAVSTTLGGLVLTSANNPRLSKKTHDDLIKVAQKLIVAAVCFIVIVSLLFLVELLGGIDINKWDLELIGWIRGISFYTAGFGFYLGVFLFLLGTLDLASALKNLRTTM